MNPARNIAGSGTSQRPFLVTSILDSNVCALASYHGISTLLNWSWAPQFGVNVVEVDYNPTRSSFQWPDHSHNHL